MVAAYFGYKPTPAAESTPEKPSLTKEQQYEASAELLMSFFPQAPKR